KATASRVPARSQRRRSVGKRRRARSECESPVRLKTGSWPKSFKARANHLRAKGFFCINRRQYWGETGWKTAKWRQVGPLYPLFFRFYRYPRYPELRFLRNPSSRFCFDAFLDVDRSPPRIKCGAGFRSKTLLRLGSKSRRLIGIDVGPPVHGHE